MFDRCPSLGDIGKGEGGNGVRDGRPGREAADEKKEIKKQEIISKKKWFFWIKN